MNQPIMGADKFIPTRRTLLSRLKSWDNQDSWREFFNTYWRLIYDFAIKAGLDETHAQDAVQETIISVANQMPGFKYDPAVGSFKSWLLQITRRRIADQLRKRYRAGETHEVSFNDPVTSAFLDEMADDSAASLEAAWETEWRNHLTEAAIEKVKQRVRPEQFQMFELAILKNWPTGKVAEALGVTLTQVYMARHRVGNLLKKEIRQLETRML